MSMFTKTKIIFCTMLGLASIITLMTSPYALAASDSNAYLGTWKGTTYTGKGTHSDIVLTLNADGSYSCSGYPPYSAEKNLWTPWQVICETANGQSNKWELILPSVIRFTHNNKNSTSSPMSLVTVSSFNGTTLLLDLPGGANSTSSLIFAEFTKQ